MRQRFLMCYRSATFVCIGYKNQTDPIGRSQKHQKGIRGGFISVQHLSEIQSITDRESH